MLLTILLAALSLAPDPSPAGPTAPPLPVKMRDCPEARTYQAEDGPNRLRPRRLDELPPGRLELAVLRAVAGCPIPAVLREGLGAAGGSESQQPSRR